MEKSIDRLKVVENIERNIKAGKFNDKVEEGDPVLTDEEREELIVNCDNLKKKWKNKFMAVVARNVADRITITENEFTEIVGIENLEGIDTGAIVTCNHFSKYDNTVIRYLMQKIGKKKKLYILVQETNMKMEGSIGWLMKNCYTIPISHSIEYIQNNFMPTLKKIFDKKGFVLIYPEQEMWFNYRKPRPLKIGAYHYACKFNVPIIPCFIEIIDTDEIGTDGFKKLKYKLHILSPIYPDNQKALKERKEEMKNADYKAKAQTYEKVYKRKVNTKFDKKKDIAGW